MKRITYIVLILFLCSFTYSLIGTIPSFNDQANPFNIGVRPDVTNTQFLPIPRHGNITNVSIVTTQVELNNTPVFVGEMRINDTFNRPDGDMGELDFFSGNPGYSWTFTSGKANISGNRSLWNGTTTDVISTITVASTNDRYLTVGFGFEYAFNTSAKVRWAVGNAGFDEACSFGTEDGNITINPQFGTERKTTIDVEIDKKYYIVAEIFINSAGTDYITNAYIFEEDGKLTVEEDDLDCFNIANIDRFSPLMRIDKNGAAYVENLIYYYGRINETNWNSYIDFNYTADLNISFFNATEIGNISLNVTKINEELDNACSCTGCEISGNNCNMPVDFISYNYAEYEINLTNLTYEFGVDNCTDFTYQILNFSYFDQLDDSQITATNGYDLTFSSGFTQLVNGTFEGAYTNEFCSIVNISKRNITIEATGQVTLEKDSYGTKLYDFTSIDPITITTPVEVKNLYMIPLENSSTVIFSWLTSTYEPIDGTMQIYQCNGDGSRTLIDAAPITDGEAAVNLELINTPYSYEIIYEGTLYTDSDSYTKCHIEADTTREYIVNVGQGDNAPIVGLYSISCNMSKVANTTARMDWGLNPESSSQITGCIFTYRLSAASRVLTDTTCSNSSPAQVIIPESGFIYHSFGKLYQNGYSIQCDRTLEFGADTSAADVFGLSGIFAIILLIAGFVLLYSGQEPKWYPIAAVISLVGAFILGFTPFGWAVISSLIFLVVVVVFVGRYHKQE